MFGALKPGFRSLATLKLVVNVVGELWTEKSCGIARFPCDSTTFMQKSRYKLNDRHFQYNSFALLTGWWWWCWCCCLLLMVNQWSFTDVRFDRRFQIWVLKISDLDIFLEILDWDLTLKIEYFMSRDLEFDSWYSISDLPISGRRKLREDCFPVERFLPASMAAVYSFLVVFHKSHIWHALSDEWRRYRVVCYRGGACTYSKYSLNTINNGAMQLLSAKVIIFKLSFEHLHIYSPRSGDFCRKKIAKLHN